MFPDLSYFFNYFFGTPVDGFLSIFKTFGLFLVLTFIVAAQILRSEFKRKEEQGLLKGQLKTVTEGLGASMGEIVTNSLFGLILGMKVPLIMENFSAFSQDPSGALLSLKGNIPLGILIAAIFGGVTYWLGNRNKLDEPITKQVLVMPHTRVMDITMVGALFGVLGSKLFSVFENFDAFLEDPIHQLFSGAGLTIYGGLILGFIAVYIYVKRIGIPPIHVMDSVAPALILGYAVGRFGCQFSGDGDWGIVNTMAKPDWFFLPDWFWSFDYPHNVVNSAYGSVPLENCGGVIAVGGGTPIYCTKLAEPVYPTPLYEIFMSVVIFGILWVLRKRIKIAGMLFFIYALLNGIERFFIEKIRVNEKYELLGLGWSLSQWIAIIFIIIGLIGIIYLKKNGRKFEDMKVVN